MNGVEIKLDIEQYLISKGLQSIRFVGNNLMARCPFHSDRKPSFGVNLSTGAYNCFGCGAKGSFAGLVKHLEHFDTEYDASEYLIRVYGVYTTTGEPLDLTFNLENKKPNLYYIPNDTLLSYRYRHPYLGKRGISEKVQRVFEVGYSKDHRAITIPWRDHKGRLLTVKMRQTFRKSFWYEPPMPPQIKKRTLWAFDKVLKWGLKKVAITEGEIDGLSVWQVEKVGNVALGGNVLTPEQAALLKRHLPSDAEIIVFTDNDAGGDSAKRSIVNQLAEQFLVTAVDWSLRGKSEIRVKYTVANGVSWKKPIPSKGTALQLFIDITCSRTL